MFKCCLFKLLSVVVCCLLILALRADQPLQTADLVVDFSRGYGCITETAGSSVPVSAGAAAVSSAGGTQPGPGNLAKVLKSGDVILAVNRQVSCLPVPAFY